MSIQNSLGQLVFLNIADILEHSSTHEDKLKISYKHITDLSSKLQIRGRYLESIVNNNKECIRFQKLSQHVICGAQG